MVEPARRQVGAVPGDLFDKYLLPKVALAIILSASLVGTAVSLALAGRWSVAGWLGKWLYFVSLGVLAGGLLWRHGFVRPDDLEAGADGYCERMDVRFDLIALVALVGLVLGAAVVLTPYATGRPGVPLAGALALVLLGLVVLGIVDAVRRRPVDEAFRSPGGVSSLVLAAAAVALTAGVEVGLQGGDVAAVAARAVHLLAFSVWVGGAVWNLFVAVPSGQAQPTTPVVRAASSQLERFRWSVRLVIPALVVTGGYQAVDVFGYRLAPYVETALGLAVLSKLGFVLVLVVIFKACPMWRACSPIDGVCDLEDLDVRPAEAPDRGPAETRDREGLADG